jgi:hypothetical protein
MVLLRATTESKPSLPVGSGTYRFTGLQAGKRNLLGFDQLVVFDFGFQYRLRDAETGIVKIVEEN